VILLPLLAAISFIGDCESATTSCTVPTHAIGDLIVTFGYKASITAPSAPTGFTAMTGCSASASSSSQNCACRIATGTDNTSDPAAWTGTAGMTVSIYRGQKDTVTCTNNFNTATTGTGATTTLTYPSTTMAVTDGTSWLFGAAGQTSATNLSSNGTPAGKTQRNATGAIATATQWDTNAGVSSDGAVTATITSANRWRAMQVEIKAACTGICLKASACTAGSGTAVGSLTITMTVTTGDDVVVCAAVDKGSGGNTVTVSGVTITGGSGSFSQKAVKAGVSMGTELWAAHAVATGGTAVVVSFSPNDGSEVVCAADYSGVVALGNTGTAGPTTSTAPSGSVTTQDANNMGVLCGTSNGGNTWTKTTGTVEAQGLNGGAGTSGALMDNKLAAAGTDTITASIDSSVEWEVSLLELRTSSGGGGATPTPRPLRNMRGAGTWLFRPVLPPDRRRQGAFPWVA
jgi:hypothetical protein